MAKSFKETVKIKLQTPVQWEGNEILTIDLNFGKLNPAAVIEAERNCSANLTSIMKMTNAEYCSNLAAYMMQWEQKIAYRVLMKLDIEDFDVIWQTVGAFISKRNPQEFYNQFTADEDEAVVGFMKPAEMPESHLIGQTTKKQ